MKKEMPILLSCTGGSFGLFGTPDGIHHEVDGRFNQLWGKEGLPQSLLFLFNGRNSDPSKVLFFSAIHEVIFVCIYSMKCKFSAKPADCKKFGDLTNISQAK